MTKLRKLNRIQGWVLSVLVFFSMFFWLTVVEHFNVTTEAALLLTLTPAIPVIWLLLCDEMNNPTPKEPMPKIGDRWNE